MLTNTGNFSSPCCNNCQFMDAKTRCRQANYANCEKEAFCTGLKAECPKSEHMPDATDCIEKGKCKTGKCVPFCETQGKQSCMCDNEANACKRCCRKHLNTTCIAESPVDILPDGTPCFQGFCHKGECEKTSQESIHIWDVFNDISIGTVIMIIIFQIEKTLRHTNINKVLKFLKDNVVGTVIFVSLLFWVPLSCLVSWVSHITYCPYLI